MNVAHPMIDDPFGGRSVKEWIGSSPDAKVPGSVRDRIFARAKGVCHLSGRKIMAGEPWDLEHVQPLSMGGAHRESNLRPALRDKHKAKSAEEAGARAKADAARRAMNGTKAEKRPIPSRPKAPAKEPKPSLPPRIMFWPAGTGDHDGT